MAKLDSDIQDRVSPGRRRSLEQPEMKNANVIQMTRRGETDAVILSVIEGYPGLYDLSPTGKAALKKAKVSDRVLATMERLAEDRARNTRLLAFLNLRSVAEAMCGAERQGKLTPQGKAMTRAEKRRYAAVYTQLVDLQSERESYLSALGSYLNSTSMRFRRARNAMFLHEPSLRTQVFLLQSHLRGLALALHSVQVNMDAQVADASSPSAVEQYTKGRAEEHAIDGLMFVLPLSTQEAGDFGLEAELNGRALEKSINAFKDLLEAKYPELASEARVRVEQVKLESVPAGAHGHTAAAL